MTDHVPTADELRRQYVKLSGQLITGMRYADSTADTTIADVAAGALLASAHVSALAQALIKKGVITEKEYWAEQVNAVRAELDRYKNELGPGIQLA